MKFTLILFSDAIGCVLFIGVPVALVYLAGALMT